MYLKGSQYSQLCHRFLQETTCLRHKNLCKLNLRKSVLSEFHTYLQRTEYRMSDLLKLDKSQQRT